MKFTQTRYDQTKNSTISTLDIDGTLTCMILEDGYRKVKEWGKTRIDPGIKRIIPILQGRFFDTYSKQFNHLFAIGVVDDKEPITDVCGRHGSIRMHIGNFVTDTGGCLLVGKRPTYDAKTDLFTISNSTATYCDKIYKVLLPLFDPATKQFKEKVTIEIVERWI